MIFPDLYPIFIKGVLWSWTKALWGDGAFGYEREERRGEFSDCPQALGQVVFWKSERLEGEDQRVEVLHQETAHACFVPEANQPGLARRTPAGARGGGAIVQGVGMRPKKDQALPSPIEPTAYPLTVREPIPPYHQFELSVIHTFLKLVLKAALSLRAAPPTE